jgi:hypothetical protein
MNHLKSQPDLAPTENETCPWFDRLTMRSNALIKLRFILSLSKDGAKSPPAYHPAGIIPKGHDEGIAHA